MCVSVSVCVQSFKLSDKVKVLRRLGSTWIHKAVFIKATLSETLWQNESLLISSKQNQKLLPVSSYCKSDMWVYLMTHICSPQTDVTLKLHTSLISALCSSAYCKTFRRWESTRDTFWINVHTIPCDRTLKLMWFGKRANRNSSWRF